MKRVKFDAFEFIRILLTFMLLNDVKAVDMNVEQYTNFIKNGDRKFDRAITQKFEFI
jgi:hypothetical protein